MSKIKVECVAKERISYDNLIVCYFKEVHQRYQDEKNFFNLVTEDEDEFNIGELYEMTIKHVEMSEDTD